VNRLHLAFIKTSTSSFLILISNVLTAKLLAVFFGPSGVGLFSIIRQTVLTLSSPAQGSQISIIKGLSSKNDDQSINYLTTVFWLFTFVTILTVIGIQAFSSQIALLLFSNKLNNGEFLVRCIALPVVFSNAYIFFKALLNGYGKIGLLAVIELIGPFVTFVCFYLFCILGGQAIALAIILLISAAQLSMLIPSFIIAYKKGWITNFSPINTLNFQTERLKQFFKVVPTTFFLALLSMACMLIVRIIVVKKFSLAEAGFFDLAWAFSSVYVGLILSGFSTYYMPTLCGFSKDIDKVNLVQSVMRLSIFLMVPLIVFMVNAKPFIINLLYSNQFSNSLGLMNWMLLGDFFKITSWVLVMPALDRLDMKTYFLSEAFWYLGFVLISAVSIIIYNKFEGVAFGFFILYAFLTFYYAIYNHKHYKYMLSKSLIFYWTVGLVIILGASLQNWNNSKVNWVTCALWFLISLIFSFVGYFRCKISGADLEKQK
jgi:O-antigen/teichoic acid export membrane protein